MIYLLEHQVGFDATGVGFPSLDGCHGILVHTANGLFGYHAYGGSVATQYQPRSVTFASFVTGHASYPGACLGLYGVSFRGRRYTDAMAKTGWRQEITAYARALGYTGKIRGLDLTGHVPPQGNLQSAYVQFDLVGGEISIHYKRWSKMQPGATVAVGAADFKQLTPGATCKIDPPRGAMKAATIVSTKSNSGEMHKVGSGALDSFTPA
jgi:hypothetical protein